MEDHAGEASLYQRATQWKAGQDSWFSADEGTRGNESQQLAVRLSLQMFGEWPRDVFADQQLQNQPGIWSGSNAKTTTTRVARGSTCTHVSHFKSRRSVNWHRRCTCLTSGRLVLATRNVQWRSWGHNSGDTGILRCPCTENKTNLIRWCCVLRIDSTGPSMGDDKGPWIAGPSQSVIKVRFQTQSNSLHCTPNQRQTEHCEADVTGRVQLQSESWCNQFISVCAPNVAGFIVRLRTPFKFAHKCLSVVTLISTFRCVRVCAFAQEQR